MSNNPGGVDNYTARQRQVNSLVSATLTTGTLSGKKVNIAFNDTDVDANGNPYLSIAGVVKTIPLGDTSDDTTVNGTLTVKGTSSLDNGAITTDGTGDITTSGIVNTKGVDTATSGAHVITPVLANGTAAQLSDVTRDYMLYLAVTTSGTANTLAIGPTSTPANTINPTAAWTAGQMLTVRVPAGWYVKWAGTSTLIATQTAISC